MYKPDCPRDFAAHAQQPAKPKFAPAGRRESGRYSDQERRTSQPAGEASSALPPMARVYGQVKAERQTMFTRPSVQVHAAQRACRQWWKPRRPPPGRLLRTATAWAAPAPAMTRAAERPAG